MAELAIIGSGPGGYGAALEAGARGIETVLVERGLLGGTCLNWGCIPTKMLLCGTNPAEELATFAKARTASGEVAIDWAALQKKKERYVAASQKAMGKRLAAAGVEVVAGTARFAGPGRLAVGAAEGEREIAFGHCVVAAGSRAAFPGPLTPDHGAVIDSDDFLGLTEVPGSLIIVGGGVIGVEMGQIVARLGCEVTVVEAMDRLVPFEDADVGIELGKMLTRKGWKIKTSARVEQLATVDGRAELTLAGGEVLAADKALVCVGRASTAAALSPERAGIELDARGWIAVDEHLLAAPGVFAVGDVNGRAMLAHAADHQGRYAARLVAGAEKAPYDDTGLPVNIYGAPETMRVGPTAAELAAAGEAVLVSRAPLAANPMAQAHAATQGFVKVVWVDDAVRGVCAAGHGVTGLTGLAEAAVRGRWTRADAEAFIFPHPSLDEALAEALRAERAAP